MTEKKTDHTMLSKTLQSLNKCMKKNVDTLAMWSTTVLIATSVHSAC